MINTVVNMTLDTLVATGIGVTLVYWLTLIFLSLQCSLFSLYFLLQCCEVFQHFNCVDSNMTIADTDSVMLL